MKVSIFSILTSLAVLTGAGAAVAAAHGELLPASTPETQAFQGAPAPAERPLSLQTSPKIKYLHQRGLLGAESDMKPDYNPVFTAGARLTDIKRTPKNVMHRTVLNPRGSIYAIVPRHDKMTDIQEAFLARLDMKSGALTPIHYGGNWNTAMGDDYTFQTCGFRNGMIIQASVTAEIPMGSQVSWQEIDPATGIVMSQVSFPFEMMLDPYQICYVPEEDLFYCLCMMADDGASHLITINPTTHQIDYIDNIGKQGYVGGLGYDPLSQTLYAFNEKNEVHSVEYDKTSLKVQLVYNGTIDTDLPLFQDGYAGQICYSPMDQAFVVLSRDADAHGTRIYMLDPNDWENPYDKGLVQSNVTPYIAAVFCTDEFADANAPDPVSNLQVSFERNSLTGQISFTAPTMTFYGVAITASSLPYTVLCDGNVVASGTVAPGGEISTSVTTTQGSHVFAVHCSLGDLQGPDTKRNVYVGYDNPLPVSNLKLDGNRLTWTAPGAVGAHHGYVDTSMLEYNVYFGDIQQNANPIEDTAYTIRIPSTLTRKDIRVVASSRGLNSEAATLSCVIGPGLSLPASFNPTPEQAALFQVINANEDERKWTYFDKGVDVKYGWLLPSSYARDADDWLILPALNFTDAESLYAMEFELRSYWNTGSVEDIEVFIGRRPTVEAMTQLIYEAVDNRLEANAIPQVPIFNFGVPEAGNWYIGIHCKSTKKNSYKGVIVNNFAVRSHSGTKADLPGAPTDIVITPAELGALSANVALTLPTVDITGRTLPADTEVSVRVNAGVEDITLTGLPGTRQSGDINVKGHGFNQFKITGFKGYNDGLTTTVKHYVGIDTPHAPKNVKHTISDDNKTMHVTWDAVPNVGVNGGYVDPSDVIYNMYMVFGGTQFTQFDNAANNCSYDFTYSENKLTKYTIAPVAGNIAGLSTGTVPTSAVLGRPHEVPVLEEYSTTGYNLGTCYFEMEGEYAKSMWGNTSSLEALGVGTAKVTGGLIYAYSDTHTPCPAGMKLGKVTTKGTNSLNFNLKYWDYAYAPDFRIDVFTSADQKWRTVGEFSVSRPAKGQWAQATITLDETMVDMPWLEFRAVADLKAPANAPEFFIIDNWSITSNADIDLKLFEIGGNTEAVVGSDVTFDLTVSNAGAERTSGTVSISLTDADGKVYDTKTINTPVIRSTLTWKQPVTFSLGGEYADLDRLIVKAEVTADGDEIPSNNSRTLDVKLHRAQVPAVNTLKGDLSGSNVSLSWDTPNKERGAYLDFEIEELYRNDGTMGSWLNLDMDQHLPVAIGTTEQNTINWPGYSLPSAWTVVDPSKINFTSDDRFKAHSGAQYVLARAAYLSPDEENSPKQSSDWLISPEVVGGTPISFWYNTVSGAQKEYVELWYSTGGTVVDTANAELTDTPNLNGNFRKIRTFSKIGSEAWEKCSAVLPKDAKHFALVYRSWNTAGAMIDDISYTPATPEQWEIDHYSLWRSQDANAPVCIAENISDLNYTDSRFSGKYGWYYVVAHVRYGDRMISGPISNLAKVGDFSSVSNAGLLSGVEAGEGYITVSGHQGHSLAVYTPDGKTLLRTVVATDTERYTLPRGIHLVIIDGSASTLIVR